MKNSKRILNVTIKTMADESPDTSWLGEYSDRPANDFAIDRKHSEDCNLNSQIAIDGAATFQNVIDYLEERRRTEGDNPDSTAWEPLEDAIELASDAQDELKDCTCSGGDMGRNEYRYFNPSFNYVRKDGTPADNLTPEEVRKYTRQDYERMESLNKGYWSFVGIRADADIQLGSDLVQTITSGGVWGLESDSGDYLEEIEGEQLQELRSQLKAIGFSTRAISKAFKDVKHND